MGGIYRTTQINLLATTSFNPADPTDPAFGDWVNEFGVHMSGADMIQVLSRSANWLLVNVYNPCVLPSYNMDYVQLDLGLTGGSPTTGAQAGITSSPSPCSSNTYLKGNVTLINGGPVTIAAVDVQ